MEHAGQLHIVNVIALATDEALIFLALHGAEADGVALGGHGDVFDGGHAFTSLSLGLSAAHLMAATMFL